MRSCVRLTNNTLPLTWKISSLWDSKEWSFSLRFLRSHNATVWEKNNNFVLNIYFYVFSLGVQSVFPALLYLISRTSSKDELAVRVKTQTVDLSSVSIHCMAGFGCVVGPSVPSDGEFGVSYKKIKLNDNRLPIVISYLHHEFLVISHRAKQGFMEQMPGNIFHHCCVTSKDGLGIHNLSFFWASSNIP